VVKLSDVYYILVTLNNRRILIIIAHIIFIAKIPKNKHPAIKSRVFINIFIINDLFFVTIIIE